MRMLRALTFGGALLVGVSGVAAGAAHAGVVSFMPNTDFSASPTTISFGNPAAASFTFSYLGSNPNDITYSVDAVATGGTGLVNTSGFPGPGQLPIPFQLGSLIGANGYTTFTALPTPTPIAYSIATDTIGLAFTLPDGLHYGYAEILGPTLVSYGYETTPGAPIATGAIPEPASLSLLAFGAATLAVRRRRGRRAG